MARHLLIASATWKYKNPQDDRPTLPKVLEDIVYLFTKKLGIYTRELQQVGENPKANDLLAQLDQWFADSQRDPDDWVVFYYTGHAEIVGADSLYLLTSDFVSGRHASTAFDFQKFADLVLAPAAHGRKRRVGNLLVILDTCFAGQGVADVSSQLALAFRRSSGSSFYLLGAALSRQEAQAGALAKALITAIDELSTRYVMQEYLYLDQIVPTINRYLRESGVQDAMRSAVDSPADIPRFFPNRSYVDTNGKPVAASEALRAISDHEFRIHWGPRARGVEFDNQPGFYFCGRKEVLSRLGTFLKDETDNRTRILTGSPGSGKSAILSRLVNISVPELRGKLPSAAAEAAVPAFDLAVHAKGKDLSDVITRFSQALEVPATKESIFERLHASRKPFRVVVDALDEALDPERLSSELLHPLSSMDSVKLLVGTRSDQLEAFPEADVIDIDRPEFASEEDLTKYVEARLLRRDEPGQSTPYSGQEVLAQHVAHSVAEKAYPNFLVARLVVEDLLSRSETIDPNLPGSFSFPTTVAAAFSDYLARFGAKEATVRDLLLPLAFAQGQGLPWDDIWAALASALSRVTGHGVDYADEDIRWLLGHAGSFILESSEDQRSVYRLFHQALADMLQAGRDFILIHKTYADALSASVPTFELREEVARKNWLLANRYIRSYLPLHAAKAGTLSDFMEQPLFLIGCDSKPLLELFAGPSKSYRSDIAAVYRDVAHWIGKLPFSAGAGYLEMQARKRGLSEFADRISLIPLDRTWEAPWARWTPPASSRSLANGRGEITCLNTDGLSDGRTVALVGRQSGSAEIWDMATGDKIAEWNPERVSYVKKLVLGKVDNHDVMVAAWGEGELGTLNLITSNEVVHKPKPGENRDSVSIMALCFATRRGQPVCITSHDADYLTMWELPNLNVLRQRHRAGAIYELHVIEQNGRSMLLGVGDSYGDSWELGEGVDWRETTENASTLHLFSLDDLSVIWEDASQREGYFLTIHCGEHLGHQLVVGYRVSTGTIEVWDIGERREISHIAVNAQKCWLTEFRGKLHLAWEWSGEFNAMPLVPITDNGKFDFRPQPVGNPVKIQGDRFSNIVTIQDRSVVLSAVLDEVRVWDMEELLDECFRTSASPVASVEKVAPLQYVGATGMNRCQLNEFYIGASDSVIAVNTSDGRTLWKKDLNSGRRVQRIVGLSNQNEIYVADGGSIYCLDISREGDTKRVIKTGGIVQTMDVVEWRGKSLAFVAVESDRVWSVRAWDLETCTEVPTNGAYQLRGGQADKALYGLTVHGGGDSIRIAFASQYGKIMVGRFNSNGPEMIRHQYFEEWRIPHAGNEYTKSMTCRANQGQILLAAGTENGHLVIWDFDTGEVIAAHANSHLGAVSSLAFGGIASNLRLLSTGVDGFVRLWNPQLEEVLSIDIGETISAATWISNDQFVVGSTAGALTIRLLGPTEHKGLIRLS